MEIQRINHVGIVVNDLPAVKAFFSTLKLEVQGEAALEGSFVEQVVGLNDVKTAMVWFRMPYGQTSLRTVPHYSRY